MDDMDWTIPDLGPFGPGWRTDKPSQAPSMGPSVGPSSGPTEAPTPAVKPDISIDTFNSTCMLAMIGFFALFLLFIILRAQRGTLMEKLFAPRLFTARVPPRMLPRGIFGWLSGLIGKKASRRVLDEVGLDAFMMNRLLIFCTAAFFCLAPFSIFVLVPLYASEAEEGTQGFKRYTIQSILRGDASSSSQIWIAVGMTYWNSVVVLYLLHDEYKIYIEHRHEFLRRAAPQNYTVLVERIPKPLCSRPALLHYFRKVFGNRVVSADVVESNPILNYAVKKRLKSVTKLERALYEYDQTGERPWRLYFPWMCGQIKQKIEPLGVSEDDADISDDVYGAALAEDERIDGNGSVAKPDGEDGDGSDSSDEDTDAEDDNDVSSFFLGENGDIVEESSANLEAEGAAATPPPASHSNLQNGGQGSSAPQVRSEEEAFLQQWQHNMEAGLAGHHLRLEQRTRPRRRKNHCLWLLARLNICMFIDSIKSYEKELAIWNRRVKRLQQKADRKRRQFEADSIANVVEPSRHTIREQLKVRLRQERRERKSQGRSSSMSAMRLRHRRSGSSSNSDSGIGVRNDGRSSVTWKGRHSDGFTAEYAQQSSDISSSDRRRSDNFLPAERNESELADSLGSAKSSKKSNTRLSAQPWDDGRNALLQSLLYDSKRYIYEFEASEVGSYFDDDSSNIVDDDEYMWDDEDDEVDTGLFEHAGFDDILRYAVDQNERTSAFVTFSTLTTSMCAAQAVMDRPLKMSICVAPDPRDILWENLGMSVPVLALFTWIIRALLVALVLVFGTLSASLAALTNLAALTKVWPWLKDWLDEHHEWAVVFQQITPMVMVILYNLVPPILNMMLNVQRRRSMSEMQVEFFQIYYHFLLIQVFVFYTIAGSLLQNIREIINHPISFLGLLGKALPNNELFFLQYLVTRCFLLSLNLLRLSDIILAILRGIFRRSKTARERRTPCCGWHTIDHPSGGNMERTIATLCLCFAIGMSYSVICPAITVVASLYFALALVVYRYQLLYVYTHEREASGQLFPFVFRALITGVLLFQLVMMGIFVLNKSPSAVTLLVPLLFITLTFLLFCENAYESSSRVLPLGDAAELDIINGFRKGSAVVYKHPSFASPAKLVPESVETDSYKTLRRFSFSLSGEDESGMAMYN